MRGCWKHLLLSPRLHWCVWVCERECVSVCMFTDWVSASSLKEIIFPPFRVSNIAGQEVATSLWVSVHVCARAHRGVAYCTVWGRAGFSCRSLPVSHKWVAFIFSLATSRCRLMAVGCLRHTFRWDKDFSRSVFIQEGWQSLEGLPTIHVWLNEQEWFVSHARLVFHTWQGRRTGLPLIS